MFHWTDANQPTRPDATPGAVELPRIAFVAMALGLIVGALLAPAPTRAEATPLVQGEVRVVDNAPGLAPPRSVYVSSSRR